MVLFLFRFMVLFCFCMELGIMRSEKEIRDQKNLLECNVPNLCDDTQFLMQHGFVSALSWVLECEDEEEV